jgi:hypothetical protein
VSAAQGTISKGTGSPRAIGIRTPDLAADTSRETLVLLKSQFPTRFFSFLRAAQLPKLLSLPCSVLALSPVAASNPFTAAPSAPSSVLREPGFPLCGRNEEANIADPGSNIKDLSDISAVGCSNPA